jgi:hypothetical protein
MQRMKPDLYSKAVLTVIAFMLVMIGCHQYVSPTASVKADKTEWQFANIQFVGIGTELWAIDTKSGDVWVYDANHYSMGAPREVKDKLKLTQLGQSLMKQR